MDPSLDDRLPYFATQKARDLDRQLEEAEKELQPLEDELLDVVPRTEVMGKHLKSLQGELKYMQILVTSKDEELTAQQNLVKVKDRMYAKLGSDLKSGEKEIQEQTEVQLNLQDKIRQEELHLASLKDALNWDKGMLEKWQAAREEEKQEAMELEMARRRGETQIREMRATLEKEIQKVQNAEKDRQLVQTEVKLKEMEVPEAMKELAHIQREYSEVLLKWEKSQTKIHAGNQKIYEISEAVAQAKKRQTQAESEHREILGKLQAQRRQNQEEKHMLSLEERQLKEDRQKLSVDQKALADQDESLKYLRLEIEGINRDLSQLKNQADANAKQLDAKHHQLALQKVRKEEAEHLLEAQTQAAQDDQTQAKAMEAYLKAQEKELADLLKRERAGRDAVVVATTERQTLKREREDLKSQVSVADNSIKKLKKDVNALDTEYQHQQKLLYSLDFNIQLMQRKIARLNGERTFKEREILAKNIETMELKLAEAQKVEKLLKSELDTLNAELKAVSKKKEQAAAKGKVLKTDLEELQLTINSYEAEAEKEKKEMEKALVDEHMLKLEMNRQQKLFGSTTLAYNEHLQKKAELEIQLREEKKDIEAQELLANAEIRTLEEEKHEETMELTEKRTLLAQTKGRYEKYCQQRAAFLHEHGLDDAEDPDVPKNEAYYLIKVAQISADFKEEIHSLRAQGEAKERQLESLHRTVDYLDARFSHQKTKASLPDPEELRVSQEKAELDDQIKALNHTVREGQRQVAEVRADNAEVTQEIQKIEGEIEATRQKEAQLQAEIQNTQEQLAKLTPKIEQSKNRLANLRQECVKKKLVSFYRAAEPREPLQTSPFEGGRNVIALEVGVQTFRENLQTLLESIHTKLTGNPDVPGACQSLEGALHEAGIRLHPIKG